MDILIVGCGWVGTYMAGRFVEKGHRVWGTCTTAAKARRLEELGLKSAVVDFDRAGETPRLVQQVFDTVIISVPVRRKDNPDTVHRRFARLAAFLGQLSFHQSFFFGSVGVYPKVDATITETSLPDEELDPKLLSGEDVLRETYPDLNILRLGGLFGADRVLAKYFVGKVCEIGYQPANFVHVEDIQGVVATMIAAGSQAKTYNVVAPEHPLKKEVIEASAAKYGYGLPAAFAEADRTAKIVSPERLVAELGYRFVYRSPLQF